MLRSLAAKLTLAFLFVGLTGALLVAFFVGQRTHQEFNRFVFDRDRVALATAVAEHYRTKGSWEGVEATLTGQPAKFRSRRSPWPGAPTLTDSNGKILFCANPERIGKPVPPQERNKGVPIQIEDNVVGWLIPDPLHNRPMPGTPEADFLARMSRAISYSAMGASMLALVLAGLLARTLTRPIRELTEAARAVARGHLGRQVTIRAHDEIGELADAFNQMSADLARANELRRQMTADIAHELRTPLSVILGYTEALGDGKLQATPAMFNVIHQEAQRLSRLVEDLRTLSLADAGELALTRRPVHPQTLLERTATVYRPQAQEKSISLAVVAPADLPTVEIDPDRITQVLGNLLSNALRHTPAGGQITLAARITTRPPQEQSTSPDPTILETDAKRWLEIQVTDTGTGITPEDLPYVFDRFYRGDKSRHHQAHETGLGLAIAKSLVEMHGGTIAVESKVGEGTTFIIRLPAFPPTASQTESTSAIQREALA